MDSPAIPRGTHAGLVGPVLNSVRTLAAGRILPGFLNGRAGSPVNPDIDVARVRPSAAALRLRAAGRGDSGRSAAPFRAGPGQFSGKFEG